MLTSTKVLQSESATLGLEPLGKGQALPQEAKFSELFASMFNDTAERTVVDGTLPEGSVGNMNLTGSLEVGAQEIGLVSLTALHDSQAWLDAVGVTSESALATSTELTTPTGLTAGLVDVADLVPGVSGSDIDIMNLVDNALSLKPETSSLYKEEGFVITDAFNSVSFSSSESGSATDLLNDESMLSSVNAVEVLADTAFVASNTVQAADLSDHSIFSESEAMEVVATSIEDLMKGNEAPYNVLTANQMQPGQIKSNSELAMGSSPESLAEQSDELSVAMQAQAATVNPTVTQAATVAVNGVQNTQSSLNSNSLNSQHITQWGAASSEAQTASSNLAQNSQSFSQGGQQQFSGQQQMMQFQAQKSQAIEQQMTVKATDELMVKADSKESLLNGELSTSDRRTQLPVGLQSIPLPVKSPQWGQALGQRVVFMANNQLQQAQITLNPEKLGPVQVKLHMDKEQQVHVTMTAQHGTTREAMENALPRLREMLEQSGINLGSVDVGDNKQFSENHSSDSDTSHSHAQADGDEANITNDMSPTKVIATDNIVDFYA